VAQGIRNLMYSELVVYRARVVDGRMEAALAAMGAVVVQGARGCGKTSTGLHHAHSFVRLDADPQAVALADLDPHSVLAGEPPSLIDEWQLAPALWNVIRHEIDGVADPDRMNWPLACRSPDDVPRHSGAGRLARVRMRPLSLAESGRSTASVSVGARGGDGPDRCGPAEPLDRRGGDDSTG